MHSSLNKKILFPSLVVIAVGLVAALSVYHFHARHVVQQELTKRLQRETQLTAQLVADWLQTRKSEVAFWAGQEVFSDALVETGYYGRSALTAARVLLASIHEGYTFYESLFLADRTGTVVTHATMKEGDPPIHLADRPYVKATLMGESAISELVTSRLSGKQIFSITAPVTANGEVIGVLAGVVDFSAFKRLFISSFKVKQYGYAFLSDAQNQILSSSLDNEEALSRQQNRYHFLDLAAKDTVHGIIEHDLEGIQFLTVFQRLPGTGWTFYISQSLDGTLRPLQNIARIGTLTAIAILVVIILVITTLFQRIIIDRLDSILHIVRKVTAGDLSERLPLKSRIPDEITELTQSFNTMIMQLDKTVSSLNTEIQVRKETEKDLADHQHNLEAIIEKRSTELEKEIVERRKTEERLIRAEKYELLGTLAGGVAHDLNNILSGIVSYPELLLMKTPPDSPLYQPLQTIRASGEKAAAVVDDLLTLTRRGVAVKEPVNLNGIVSSYLASPEFKKLCAYHPDVRVIAETSKDLHNILGSPIHLTKTLMNLVTNAMESMGHGGIVKIRTENRYIDDSLRLFEHITQGEYAVLQIEDQGSGIDPEDREKIFEPFYTKKQMGRSGTGLGMSVVWGTVKDHEGYIDCSSIVGEGTTFSLFFPITSIIYQEQANNVEIAHFRGHGEHILLVDDVDGQRTIVTSILSELGYRVKAVSSGEEAALLAGRETFDLLLLDMILGPGMDGLDVYRQYLRYDPHQKAIITSGFSETERITEAIRLGVGQYLKKPYSINKLAVAIRDELTK